ncbi:hypothetical protein GDO86_007898 [Hymenochirus boettgeri]|uniref:Coiled-coil domain-containing protein 24 n=1 Tax=Hymenochirus boettgeri TaxID=247094 RepID=A0A8T2J0R9_9PIPI|nr:hypothetical protein GDO86_007898 [Hymenochirus boettgeri]
MLQPTSNPVNRYGEMFQPPQSIWKLVEQQVPVSERDEIKRILGEAVIDLSLELHAEVEVLLNLWKEVRTNSPTSEQNSLHKKCSILADPPVIKNMVTQEIRMLLLTVRQKARQDGMDIDLALSKYNPKVVNFALGAGQSVSKLNDQSISQFEMDSSDERSLLMEECKTLERDLQFLQQCLEEDQFSVRQPHHPEPTLSELREERRVIEHDLQRNQLAVTSEDFQKSLKLPRRPTSGNSKDYGVNILPHSPASIPKTHAANRNHAFSMTSRTSLTAPTYPFKSLENVSTAGAEQSLDIRTGAAVYKTSAHVCLYDPHKTPEPPSRISRKVLAPNCAPTEQNWTLPKSELVPQRLGAVFVPSPPQDQRPDNSSNSFTSLRRVRPLQSLSSS